MSSERGNMQIHSNKSVFFDINMIFSHSFENADLLRIFSL